MDNVERQVADPLPYIIIFAILFFVALGVLTWTLDMLYKQHQCAIYPNIWCSDNWTCATGCPSGYTGNKCFIDVGPTGLASCIFGPDAPGATACFFPPSETGGTACNCPASIQQTQNCFNSCASNFTEIDINTSTCCCCPGTKDCPWTEQNPPPSNCGFVQGQPCVKQTNN